MDITGIGSVADLAKSVINKIWPDKTEVEKQQMAIALATMQNEMDLAKGQLEVNKIEAASTSVFVSGWRPFIGWVCGAGCAWNWLGLPVTKACAALVGHPLAIAPADLSEMMPLLLGMLGIGTLRTVEKIRGVAAK